MNNAETVARAVDVSLRDVEKVVVRNALGADNARAAGATNAEIMAVVKTCNALNEALNALSVSVRS